MSKEAIYFLKVIENSKVLWIRFLFLIIINYKYILYIFHLKEGLSKTRDGSSGSTFRRNETSF